MCLCFDMVGHRRVIKVTDIWSVMHIHELIIQSDLDTPLEIEIFAGTLFN